MTRLLKQGEGEGGRKGLKNADERCVSSELSCTTLRKRRRYAEEGKKEREKPAGLARVAAVGSGVVIAQFIPSVSTAFDLKFPLCESSTCS